MTLTPAMKFAVIAVAFTINLLILIWTGIKVDALAMDMNEHAYNIVLTIITILNTGATGLLVYLGLKAPTAGDRDA